MPCYMTGSYAGDLELSAQESHEEAVKVTRLLCATMHSLKINRKLRLAPVAARKWYIKHERNDRKRK